MVRSIEIRVVAVVAAALALGCADPSGEDDSSPMDAIQAACDAYIERSADCSLIEDTEPEVAACVEGLAEARNSNPACSEADIVLYTCLSQADCETFVGGGACQSEIAASQEACGDDGEPEMTG